MFSIGVHLFLRNRKLRAEVVRLRQDRRFLIERCFELRDLDAQVCGVSRFAALDEERRYIEAHLSFRDIAAQDH